MQHVSICPNSFLFSPCVPPASPKPLCDLPVWHLPLCLTGVIPTSSTQCSVKRLAKTYMLMSCKCHIADRELRHINARRSVIISHRSVLSLTRRLQHPQMLLKVSGQHITGDSAEASGNICCDTWLHKVACAHEHEHIHALAPSDAVHHHTHTYTHTQSHTQSWLLDEGVWLMKACVHYYNAVSVEASSFDHIFE